MGQPGMPVYNSNSGSSYSSYPSSSTTGHGHSSHSAPVYGGSGFNPGWSTGGSMYNPGHKPRPVYRPLAYKPAPIYKPCGSYAGGMCGSSYGRGRCGSSYGRMVGSLMPTCSKKVPAMPYGGNMGTFGGFGISKPTFTKPAPV